MRIHLIACSGSKLSEPAPARDLYTGDLFRACRAYAEHQGGPWAILSAQHRLVKPGTVLEPYDLRLSQLDRDHRQAWVFQVEAALLRWLLDDGAWSERAGFKPCTFVLLAGSDYTHTPGVAHGLADRIAARGWGLELPLAGMAIGKQRQWLRRQVEEPALPGVAS